MQLLVKTSSSEDSGVSEQQLEREYTMAETTANGLSVDKNDSHATTPEKPLPQSTPRSKAPHSPSKSKVVANSNYDHHAASSPIKFDFCNSINPQDLLEMTACPCCHQNIDDKKRQTLLGCTKKGSSPRMIADLYGTASVFDNDLLESDEEDEDEGKLPNGVTEGLSYYPRRILVEGWLHKKGTGKDWLGSRSWKARWARLVMARLQGYEVDVPLLMIYWYAETSSPSNVIVLDSTVVFPIDIEDKERWDAYRFDVRNARTVCTNTTVNRTFCAPKKARDAWIYAISQALLVFEKENDKARKATHLKEEVRRLAPPQNRLRYPRSFSNACAKQNSNNNKSPFDEAWTDRKKVSSPPRNSTPPTSPRSRKNNRSPGSGGKILRNTKRVVPRPASPKIPKPGEQGRLGSSLS